jgi:hypothetical protein
VDDERLRAIEAADRALRDHPGQQRRRDLEGLWISVGQVMMPNLRELVTLLRQPAADDSLFAELIQNVRPPVVREQYQGELTRRLANYVASALALVEHVRRLTRRSRAPFMDEFHGRLQVLAEQPEVSFIQDLRNFTLHRRLPALGHTASLQIDGDVQRHDFAVILDRDDLLGWKGWSARSRRFIEQHPDGVELERVIERHGELTVELNTWVHDQLQEEFEPLRQELNLLIRRRHAALFNIPETEVDQYIRERLDGMGGGPWNSVDD